MTQSRREANKIKCRQQILKASRRLFRERGYEDTMIEEVAEKAEISKGTLYNYFPNKESLLIGTMEEEAEALKNFLEKDIKKIENPDERIKQALIFLITDSIPFIDVSRKIMFLNAGGGTHMRGQANNISRLFIPIVEEAQRRGIYRDDADAEAIVDIIMSLYLTAQFRWIDMGELSEAECAGRVEKTFNLVFGGIYADK